jgi:hypothetical protein
MMSKFHLIQSQTPLSEGRDQDAMCGKTVLCAVFATLSLDMELSTLLNMGEFLGGISCCRKCLSQPWTQRYIYAAKAGNDEHQPYSSLSD